MSTPVSFASIFFWSVLHVSFTARLKHVGLAIGEAAFWKVALLSPTEPYVDRSAGLPMLISSPLIILENTVKAVSG